MATIETAFGAISYTVAPARTPERRWPAVLVHGAGGNANIWEGVRDRFTTLRAHAIDLPGHGRSAGTPCPDMKTYAEAVEAARQELGLQRIVIVGHSLGGMVAQWYARLYPERCGAIVLACSGPDYAVDAHRLAQVEGDWTGYVELNYPQQVSPRADQRLLDAARALVQQRDPRVFRHDWLVCGAHDAKSWLDTLTVPCLVIGAYEDRLVPLPGSLALYSLIRGAHLAVIGPAGHSVMLEHPARFAAAVDSFIKESVPPMR
jgi:pimeloyl-ACP methyl ester carboxylesterase